MKEVKAILRNLQISPRKVQLVAQLIRGNTVAQARHQLTHNPKNAAKPMLKLLNSAVANAEHNNNLNTETLRVKNVMVGQGPVLKRFTPRAFGRATTIRKRMSHIKIVLEGEELASALKTKKKAAPKTRKPKNASDIEKQPPAKKGGRPSSGKKPESVDPRSKGHERPMRRQEQHNKKAI